MDLESFLALEKERLVRERQELYKQSNELKSAQEPNGSFTHQSNRNSLSDENNINKETKDWINKQHNTAGNVEKDNNHQKERQDDMEQWVSDTFYSYFPGFNNEYQKRQNELQKRLRENQENLIRHQMLDAGQSRKKKYLNVENPNVNSERSDNSSLTSNGNSLHGGSKIDMEIINVDNANYMPSKQSTNTLRPNSARYRLLQDLRHTNLTNFENGITDNTLQLGRKQAEIESFRKKEYQRELMQQIEEKRRTIKLLKEKEREEEQVLTRRLEEQLKTMKLEEQLEKERLEAVKVRFAAEKNHLTREQLLAKLEKDSQMLLNEDFKATNNKHHVLDNDTNKENIPNRQDNKVYKYFSNSAKHEYSYRSKSSLPIEIDFEEDQTEISKIERECFHLSEKICPLCNEPLKELENFCLRCQNKISFRIRSPLEKNCDLNLKRKSMSNEENDQGPVQHENKIDGIFILVCMKCECLYSWCKTCRSKSDVCRACQNKRNLCMNCRKTLCSFCLEEIASGKDTENLHINDCDTFLNQKNQRNESVEGMSFHIMTDDREVDNDNKTSDTKLLSPEYFSLNNLENITRPQYPMQLKQDSVPDKPLSLFSQNKEKHLKANLTFYNKDHFRNSLDVDGNNIERLRRDTDNKLSRYLKNYGDLAYQTRGTQTTPTTSARRDIVIQGEPSLTIPLLREMPKMTRADTIKIKTNSKELEDLQRRWDIPAVQKYTISSNSPRVVTQVGAIKKQLQAERIFAEKSDS